MDEEDAEKTAFITLWGVYQYRVMSFGLKNAGATYMRAMTTIFHDMIYKEIEVCVDDVIIKSRESSDHLTHLKKFFDRLHRYNWKLNPAKCAFGVPARKLLGFIYVQKLCKKFRNIEFRHSPRIQNELSVVLATISSMIKHPETDYIDPLDIELKGHPIHCFHVETEPDGLPWYFDIKKYLESGTYPEDATANQQKSIRRVALNLFLSGEVLYRRTPDLGLLRCIDVVEVVKLIEQIHAGVCRTHMNVLTLARKILRAGYFWITMENDCCKFVQKCHKCQVHDDLISVPPHELNSISSPWPFVAWGMDVIGPI
ncbi:uncharacterized protein LOC107023084 [Solanum pennellii]|uniref:Uncharacterized protein LOC107023084 n=1 Tax=Solanum pennellii TaxID=28526 RepID=A0ABM1H1N0_SOLPN|nr:uncharacterized protein LOC107023084 [Solanum pennellii]